jgi:hypothetical protein
MQVSRKTLAIGALAVLAAFGSVAASAQTWNGGGTESIGQSTSPMPLMHSTISDADVQAGAMAAAHPAGTESIGQSTSPMPLHSTRTSDDVYASAVAATHSAGTESIGQSTSLPLVGSATSN